VGVHLGRTGWEGRLCRPAHVCWPLSSAAWKISPAQVVRSTNTHDCWSPSTSRRLSLADDVRSTLRLIGFGRGGFPLPPSSLQTLSTTPLPIFSGISKPICTPTHPTQGSLNPIQAVRSSARSTAAVRGGRDLPVRAAHAPHSQSMAGAVSGQSRKAWERVSKRDRPVQAGAQQKGEQGVEM
jgi:hypothetical protein